MRYDQDETNGKVNAEPRNAEAELFAEILNRLDEKKDGSKDAQPGNQPQSAKTIDLVELFYYMLSKLHYILLGMLIGALLLGVYASRRVTPIYTATSKLYIMGTTGSSIIADLQIGTVLTMDYQEVFKTWEIQKGTEASLGTEDCQKIQPDRLEIDNPEGTRVLYISYTCEDPQLAANAANAYALAGQKFMSGTMHIQQPLLFSEAIPPSERTSMGQKGFAAMGFLWGTAFAVWIIFMKFTFDDHPHRPEDIEAAAGIPTLAIIPKSQRLPGASNNKRQR